MTNSIIGFIGAVRDRLSHPFPFWSGWTSESARLFLVSAAAIAITVLLMGPEGLPLALQLGIACIITGGAMRASFAMLVDDQFWTVGRVIIFYVGYVMLITAAILFVLALHGLRPENILVAFLGTGAACIIPITLDVFQSENTHLKRSVRELEDLHALLEQRQSRSPVLSAPDNTAMITPEAGEARHISATSLIHVRSRQNYCELFLGNDKGITSTVLMRLPLKSFLEQANTIGLIQTHRSWAINPDRVIKAGGNAQGYVLTLEDSLETVPVSRRFAQSVRSRLKSESTDQHLN